MRQENVTFKGEIISTTKISELRSKMNNNERSINNLTCEERNYVTRKKTFIPEEENDLIETTWLWSRNDGKKMDKLRKSEESSYQRQEFFNWMKISWKKMQQVALRMLTKRWPNSLVNIYWASSSNVKVNNTVKIIDPGSRAWCVEEKIWWRYTRRIAFIACVSFVRVRANKNNKVCSSRTRF